MMTVAPGSTAVITPVTSLASVTHWPAGTATSSLIGTPTNPAASGLRSR